MRDEDILTGALLEEACLSLEQLAQACEVSFEWVVYRVEEGVLAGGGAVPSEWRFSSRDLWRARSIRALERDFDAVPELAALVTDLIEEVQALRARLRRAGLE
ncbi:MAG: MerR family transcriptional regulator [Betaproteobacteria bacterium]|nr:MerR family transcriptional regulator [Betaproteobacteria bacterium]